MVPLLPSDTQVLGGLELGGVPIATMVSALTGLPAIFVRKEAKTYGPADWPRAAISPTVRSRSLRTSSPRAVPRGTQR